MKKKISSPNRRPLGRGRFALGFLVLSILVAGAALLGVAVADDPRAFAGADPLTVAKVAFVDGDHARADELLRRILTARPDHKDAKVLLGRVALERGRPGDAQKIFSEVLKSHPQDYAATRGLAASFKALGQADLAVAHLARAAQLRPDDPAVWKALGLEQKEAGNTFDAVTSLQRSMKLDPNQADLTGQLSDLVQGLHARPAGAAGFSNPMPPQTASSLPYGPSYGPKRPEPPDPLMGLRRAGGFPR